MLLVQLEVLLERILDVLIVDDLAIDNVEEVFKDHVDFGHG